MGRAGLYPPSAFLNLVSGSCPVLRGSNSAGGGAGGAGKEWKTKYGGGERGQRKRNSPAFFTPKTREENASTENANWFVFLLLRFIKSGTQPPSFRAHVGRKATAPFLNVFHNFDSMNVGGGSEISCGSNAGLPLMGPPAFGSLSRINSTRQNDWTALRSGVAGYPFIFCY